MSIIPPPVDTHRIVPFLVCESGRRWCDAARRFVGPFQHAKGPSRENDAAAHDQLAFAVVPVDHSKVRASISGQPKVAVLWEITPDNAKTVALTIAQIGVGRSDVFQVVAMDNEQSATTRDLSLRIMELGVPIVVYSPEHLAAIARIVRRRFSDSF